MSDRAETVFAQYREASQRFNYFVTGASGAFCAYLVERWTPSPIGSNPGTLELCAILLLAASAFFGFRLFEKEVLLLRNNFLSLDYGSKRDALGQALASGGMVSTSEGMVSPDVLSQHITTWKERIQFLSDIMDKSNDSMALSYRWRNWLLGLGAVAFFLSRLMVAYVPH